MVQKKISLGLCLNIFRGYSFERSLGIAKEFGFETIEPGNIDFSFDQIKVEDVCDTYIDELKQIIDHYKMKVYAFSAHSDIHNESGFKRYLEKYKIAKAMGATVVVGNASPDDKKEEFISKMCNIKSLIEEDNKILVFETPGDLDCTYKNASEAILELNHPQININYDCGNLYFRSQGEIIPGKDIDKAIINKIKYFHIKDLKKKGEKIVYSPIGEGDINFDDVIDVLKQTDTSHVSLEIPVYLWSSKWQGLQMAPTPLKVDVIKYAIDKSQEYLLNRYNCFELS